MRPLSTELVPCVCSHGCLLMLTQQLLFILVAKQLVRDVRSLCAPRAGTSLGLVTPWGGFS